MDELTKGDIYIAQAEAAAKLRVRQNEHEPPGVSLVVDAEALTDGNTDVRYWRLFEVDGRPGEWVHPESGESGPLSEVLRGIANCYLDPPPCPDSDNGIEVR